jgi:error-prone DNA polymerase
MARVFHRYPGVVQRGAQCAFDLQQVTPELPPFPVPNGHTEATYVRHLTRDSAARR